MATFKESIEAEIASHQAQIDNLKTHLLADEKWLTMESGLVWEWIKHLFAKTPSPPAA